MSTYTLYAALGVFNLVGASELSNFELDPAVGTFGLAGQAVSFSASTVPPSALQIAATVGYDTLTFDSTTLGVGWFPYNYLGNTITQWNSTTAYTTSSVTTDGATTTTGNLVYLAGAPNAVYACIANNTNQMPPNVAYWSPIAVQNLDGSITLPGPAGNAYSATLCSNNSGGGAGGTWQGVAFDTAAYIEYEVSFPAAPYAPGFAGCWQDCTEFLLQVGPAWPNQSIETEHWFEDDTMQAPNSNYNYECCVPIDWYQVSGSGAVATTIEPQSLTWISFTPGQFNRFGLLRVPATSSTPGYTQSFLNGLPVGPRFEYQQYNPTALRNPPPVFGAYNSGTNTISPTQAASVADLLHASLILGTNITMPMTIRKAVVYQTSAANNLTSTVPTLASLSPNVATAGGAQFTVTAAGTNFTVRSSVAWNGVALATTYVNATTLTAVVPATNIASVTVASITVWTGGSYNTSNAQSFTVSGVWARVTAVTAGQYRGQDYYPGDVFDIYAAGDFSNSTVNYQPASSGTVGFGWMSIVPQTTPLYSWLSANNAPYLPAQDPLRRFVF